MIHYYQDNTNEEPSGLLSEVLQKAFLIAGIEHISDYTMDNAHLVKEASQLKGWQALKLHVLPSKDSLLPGICQPNITIKLNQLPEHKERNAKRSPSLSWSLNKKCFTSSYCDSEIFIKL